MKKLLIISYSIIILGIIILGILSMSLEKNDYQLFKEQEQRYQSYLLVDELRQSSDDLTRMARTYVVTGDEKYEKMYWDILAIRNGEKPRPQNYNRIYWDLILNYGDKLRPDDVAIPLQTLMQQAEFTEDEFAKLHESQHNSDNLVKAETVAMNAVRGLYDDGNGNYVKRGEPDYEMARKILHDADYHKYKANIMQPINEFLQLLDLRTKDNLIEHTTVGHSLLLKIEIMVVVLIIISIIIAIFVTRKILQQVGGEPTKIASITKQVAAGNLNIELESGTATGIYADIQIMVQNFNTVIADIIHISQGLENGDLNIVSKAEYKGDFAKIKNALEKSLANQSQVIEDIIAVSKGLASNNLSVIPQAKYRGDFIQIKHALEKAATELAKVTTQNDIQNWIKTGQADFNEIIRGDQDIASLAKNIITFLCNYVDAQVGLFYLLKKAGEQEYLEVISSYAYIENNGRSNKCIIGEGLVGQAALERKTIYLHQAIEECPNIIRSGLSNAIPHHISVSPCLYENSVKAVLEIGNSIELSIIQREFLEQVLPNIGIAINTANSRTQMQKLLQAKELSDNNDLIV